MSTRHLTMKITIAILTGITIAVLSGCANGRYIGPSIGLSAGYQGVTVAVSLFGENPAAVKPALSPEPSPTPASK